LQIECYCNLIKYSRVYLQTSYVATAYMSNIKLNKRSLIRWKVYIDRARMYIGYIQFFMIGIIFLERFYDIPVNDAGMTLKEFVNEYIWIVLPVFFLLFILSSLIIGFLDTRFGLREEEMRNASNSNPVLREIQADLKEMKMKLAEIKKQMQSGIGNEHGKM
jgi:hypothetical protein